MWRIVILLLYLISELYENTLVIDFFFNLK